MKKILCIILSSLFLTALLSGCTENGNKATTLKEPPEIGFLTPDQFEGYTLGTIENLVSEADIADATNAAEIYAYSEIEEGLDAVRNKEIHGFVLPTLYASQELAKVDNLEKIPFPLFRKDICAVSLDTFKYSLPMDATLTTLRDNATSERIALSHSPFPNPVSPYSRPQDYEKIEGRKVVFGISSDDNYPYNYRAENGELIGINVDVAYEIAAGVFAELEIKEYPEADLISALEKGEVDVVMSTFSLEEGEMIPMSQVYSHPYYTATAEIIVDKENTTVLPVGFLK